MDNKFDQTTMEQEVIQKAENFLKEEVQSMDEELELPIQERQPKVTAKHSNPLAKGAVLKKIREEKGLTLEMVQEATKIPLDSLRAIEEGYSVRTLSPFYYKGFVKIYCQYLNVDLTEVLGSDFRIKETTADLMRKMPVEEINFSSWYDKFLTRQRKRQIVIWVAGAIVLFVVIKILFGIGNWIKEHPFKKKVVPVKVESVRRTDDRSKKIDSPVEIVMPKAEMPKVKVEQETAQADMVDSAVVEVVNPVDSQSTEASGPIANKEIMLTVRSKKNSWLRVKTDGQTVFQSTLKQGAVETWNADDNIEISGKNLSQLEVELNGKMIGNLGRNNAQASTVVITKKGLSVIK